MREPNNFDHMLGVVSAGDRTLDPDANSLTHYQYTQQYS